MYTKVIAITGYNGFIGSNLCSKLKGKEKVVELNIRNFKSPEDLSKFLVINKVTNVINCIGGKTIGYSLKNPICDFDSNVQVTSLLVYSILMSETDIHLTHISSAGVYGEQDLNYKTKFKFSPYSIHKKISEEIIKLNFFNKNNYLIVRPFSVYGPGLKKQILWDAYHKFKEENKNQIFYGSGNEVRNFIYIDDLCEIIINHSLNNVTGLIDIGSNEKIAIKQLLIIFSELLDVKANIQFNGISNNYNPNNLSEPINELIISHKNFLNIEFGLKKYINWIEKYSL